MARVREFRISMRVCSSIVAALLASSAPSAYADFILTRASGVYQHSNGTSKVIIGSKNDAQGIFVMVGAPIAPQEFNLETTPPEGMKHIFIRFDGQAQPPTYSEIVINDKVYKVSGNLTLNLGKTYVSIDNNNPYLTIVTEGSHSGEPASILGFSGLNEIVKGTGPIATILAANQLNPEVAKVILPYTVENNELRLNGKPVTTPVIGTFVRPENECLKPTSVVLFSTDLAKITSAKGEDERIQLLDKFMTEAKKSNPLRDHLVLKADPKSVILLDIRDKNIHEMHEVQLKSARQRICVISNIVPK
jgi:hypothetical protein